MPLLGGLLGGTRLGNAHGIITIDTSGAERAQLTMRRVGQNTGKSFTGIARGARTFSAEINKVNRELTALGIVGGIISAMGIRAAASFEEVQVQLVGMTGSLEAASELAEQLRARAAAAGLPFADLLQAAKQLLPTLEGNTEELGAWLDLTRRVAVLNQREGIQGAAFAINEALTSGGTDLISLTERFNISRVQLREALEETGGDFAAALDQVLARMGITQQTADAMGRTFNASFRAAKDAAVQLLAEGFEPLLKVLMPILSGTAQWLSQLREAHPEVATLGAALASIVTVGAPTLIFLNQVAQALQRIKTLKAAAALGTAIKTVGVLGGAAVLGANIGVQVGRGVGRATGDERMANATMRDALNSLGQVIFIGARVIGQWLGELAKILARAQEWLANGFSGILDAIGRFIQRLLDLIPGPDIGPLRKARELSEQLLGGADEMRAWGEKMGGLADEVDAKRDEWLVAFGRFIGVLPQAAQDLAAGARAAGQQAAQRSRFTSEQADAIQDWAAQVQQIEASANQQRLDVTRQYEQQRTELIASYELTIAREAEDFARSRARQQTQLAKDIADIHADAAQRERKWQEDLNDKLIEIRGEGNERIAEIEAEGQRNLERMRADHRNRLMEAAARLDARAVAEEQRRFQTQVTQAEDDLSRRVEAERENLNERIEQEREAHQQRLEEARAADAQRVADMRAALAERQALEDDDRALRLERMQKDHEAQLAAMAAQQAARIAQINQGAIEERNAAWDGLLDRLEDLGLHNQAWLELQKDRQEASIELFDTYWKAFQSRMTAPSSYGGTSGAGATTGSTTTSRPAISPARYDPFLKQWISGPMLTRQAGGPVYDTAATMLHGSRSRPEYVLSAETTQLLRSALGGAFTQRQLVGAVAGGRNVTVQSGAISMPIYAAPGQSPTDIAAQVEQVLTGFFRRLGG